MNVIIDSYIKEFKNSFEYFCKPESVVFELFCSYCIASNRIQSQTITKNTLDGFIVGGTNDWGIDSVIIIINGRFIETEDQVDELAQSGSDLRVDVLLTQAKTSSSIETGDFHKFATGYKNILKFVNGENVELDKSVDLSEKLQIISKIYENANLFYSEDEYKRPKFHLYFAHKGSSESNQYLDNSILNLKQIAKESNLCSELSVEFLNIEKLENLYMASKKRLSKTIIVDQHLPLNEIENISEGHLCLIPFSQFKKLIINESDNSILRSVFEDNVRDYQGHNPVNESISRTLKNGDIAIFTALNNGITIIAQNMKFVGQKLTMNDYQIVNGCQTCHVLFENINLNGIDDVVLTVKIISSSNKSIRDKIIVANNNQTEVKREQLTSLLDSQRKIEEYYLAEKRFVKLFYERRSKQYHYGDTHIKMSQIVTIPAQIMAFVSMILGQPHLTSHYYGSIIEKINSDEGSQKIFDDSTNPAFYYMSALAAYKRDYCLSSGKLTDVFRHVKHHLLYALRLVALETQMPRLNDKSSQKYCDDMCELLCDDQRCTEAFQRAGKLMINTLNRQPNHNDLNDPGLAKRIKEQWFRQKSNLQFMSSEDIISTENNPIKIKIVGTIDLGALNKNSRKSSQKHSK